MQNLNSQIDSLFAALGSSTQDNDLLGAGLPLALNTSAEFAADIAAVRLTEEESAIAQPTIERVEIDDQLDDYINRVEGARRYLGGERTTPDWLKVGDTDMTVVLERFFTQVVNEAALTDKIAVDTPALTLASMQDFYTQRTALVAQEQLAAAAQKKVRQAVDLRIALIALLRYRGLTGSAIAELYQSA